METSGTFPTNLKLKVWEVGTPEPADWDHIATDSTANLQAAGGFGLRANISSLATNPAIVFSFDDYSVGGLEDEEPPTSSIVVQDDFNRTVAAGWSSANVGGPFAYYWGSAAINDFSVNGSEGVFTMSASGAARELSLDDVSVLNSLSTVTLSLSDIPSAKSYVRLYSRRVNSSSGYRGVIEIGPSGDVSLWVDRLANGSWARVSMTDSVDLQLVADGKYHVCLLYTSPSPRDS